jgi:predicted N-formylglutamate amidohydrolase
MDSASIKHRDGFAESDVQLVDRLIDAARRAESLHERYHGDHSGYYGIDRHGLVGSSATRLAELREKLLATLAERTKAHTNESARGAPCFAVEDCISGNPEHNKPR